METMGFGIQFVVDVGEQRKSRNNKTTAPTVCLKSFRAILHLTATLNWDLKQFNIKTAFLHGILPKDKSMYMEQPPGFKSPGKEDWIM